MIELDSETEVKALSAAFEWFVSAMPSGTWPTRRKRVKEYMDRLHAFDGDSAKELTDPRSRISFDEDSLAWYLFLTEARFTGSHEFDYAQGSRVIPFMFRIGNDLALLKRVNGVDDRLRAIVGRPKYRADSGLFELVVALTYVRNGWHTVELVPEGGSEKTPDIRVQDSSKEFFIECKRMAKSSDYAIKEREKWLVLWQPVIHWFWCNRKPVVMDITFHVELDALPDDYLQVELLPKLDLVVCPATLVDNGTWTVKVRSVDFEKINAAFQRMDIRVPSPLLMKLVVGEYEEGKECSCATEHRFRNDARPFVSEIVSACAAVYYCDADAAMRKRARHIKGLVANACDQIAPGAPGIIHVGFEAHDTSLVESQRQERIRNELVDFDPRGKRLHYIYLHAFRPRSTVERHWDFQEDVTWLSPFDSGNEPLIQPYVVSPPVSTHKG
jgi:hypothetical protein